VKDNTYLGKIQKNKTEVKPVIEKIITNANRAYFALLSLLKSQSVFTAEKIKIYKALTLRLLMPYIYGAPSKARNANVVYIWTYVWQR